jgi:putrescine transport system substrate-binding protein
LASGETCLAMTYSGDVIQAAARAKEAGRGVEVRYITPREGAQLSFDVMAMPADAPNKDAALAFIDFMLRPDVMAAITNQVRYPNAVPASRANIKPDILGDTNIYPPQDAFGHFFNVTAISQQAERARTRLWSRFKAGR